MKPSLILTLFICIFYQVVFAQKNKGINFQAIARNENGIIIANKQLNIRLSILSDSLSNSIEYQEIKSTKTNVLGLFSVILGAKEEGKIISSASFENINWISGEKFLQIEIDPANNFNFIHLGIQRINYVPFALYADQVDAKNIKGIIGLDQGGLGVNNIKDFKSILQIDKVNNTADSLKPITKLITSLLNKKLDITDTSSLSNRINLKQNKLDTSAWNQKINKKLDIEDTSSLSNRINLKISKGELSKAELIASLGFSPIEIDYGNFYDTTKQTALSNTATAVKWNHTLHAKNTAIVLNSANMPTRISVVKEGIYLITYKIQVVNPLVSSDEMSVWIRRNSSAYINTNTMYLLGAANSKLIFTGSQMIDLGKEDYIELYFSVKSIHTQLIATLGLTSPARPMTPSAQLMIHRIQ